MRRFRYSYFIRRRLLYFFAFESKTKIDPLEIFLWIEEWRPLKRKSFLLLFVFNLKSYPGKWQIRISKEFCLICSKLNFKYLIEIRLNFQYLKFQQAKNDMKSFKKIHISSVQRSVKSATQRSIQRSLMLWVRCISPRILSNSIDASEITFKDRSLYLKVELEFDKAVT